VRVVPNSFRLFYSSFPIFGVSCFSLFYSPQADPRDLYLSSCLVSLLEPIVSLVSFVILSLDYSRDSV
jgi:hypothetical protein